MKTIIALIIFVLGAGLCKAQPNTITTYPCSDPACQVEQFQYAFCSGGRLLYKCSADPNNEPGMKPLKKATPMHFCYDFSNCRTPILRIRDSTNPNDIPDTIFNVLQLPGILYQAESRWTSLCPAQGPNTEYQYCCVPVIFSSSPNDFATSPGGVQRTRAFTSMLKDNGTTLCAINCAESWIVINQEPEYTQPNESGGPHNFLFTDPSKIGRLTQDYHYASAYSVMLHEEGHWLGFGHSDTYDSQGGACPHPNSIMQQGDKNNWDSRILDLSPDDICMFKKLYCCKQTENHSNDINDQTGAEGLLTFEARSDMSQSNLILTFSRPTGNVLALIRLIDATGKILVEQEVLPRAQRASLNIAALHSGTYVVELLSDRTTFARKVQIIK